MNPRITVAICTWNRAASLAQTLETLARMAMPSELTWELLVVSNACTDETDRVIASFAGRLPVRALPEPELGLSHARNCAVAAALGEYIVWTDDDVLVSENWLRQYYDAFRRWPAAVLFGGPVVPRYTAPPPSWLKQMWPQAAGYYAMRNSPGRPEQITADYLPNGANYALRMDVQRQHLYRVDLGRRGSAPFGGEEWHVISAVLREGGTGWWVPDALVEHTLSSERLTTAYLRRVIRCQGEFSVRTNVVAGASMLGRPLRLWRKVVLSELRYRWHRTISRPEVWFPLFQRASFLQGEFRGYRSAALRV